jgi:hypothetical protein
MPPQDGAFLFRHVGLDSYDLLIEALRLLGRNPQTLYGVDLTGRQAFFTRKIG